MKKVITFGTFDILHPGHIHVLKKAREYGDYLTVVIARDATVETVKGRGPVHSENVRLKNIQDLRIADNVRLGSLSKDKYQVIREENPDVIALGYDQKVFVDALEDAVDDHVSIVRITPYMPEKYKSSKLRPKE